MGVSCTGTERVWLMASRYADKAALETHGNSDYFKELTRTFKNEDLLAEPMKVLFTEEAGGYASKL
jgi:quinol monooxygenase YgiN